MSPETICNLFVTVVSGAIAVYVRSVAKDIERMEASISKLSETIVNHMLNRYEHCKQLKHPEEVN